MSTGTDPSQQPAAEPLHDAHVACWWDVRLAVGLNERATAAYERENGSMTEEQRRLSR